MSDENVTKSFGTLFVWIIEEPEAARTRLRICCATHRDWHHEATITKLSIAAAGRRDAFNPTCALLEALARHSLKSCACASPLELT